MNNVLGLYKVKSSSVNWTWEVELWVRVIWILSGGLQREGSEENAFEFESQAPKKALIEQ